MTLAWGIGANVAGFSVMNAVKSYDPVVFGILCVRSRKGTDTPGGSIEPTGGVTH
jgi:hypothetical protein